MRRRCARRAPPHDAHEQEAEGRHERDRAAEVGPPGGQHVDGSATPPDDDDGEDGEPRGVATDERVRERGAQQQDGGGIQREGDVAHAVEATADERLEAEDRRDLQVRAR